MASAARSKARRTALRGVATACLVALAPHAQGAAEREGVLSVRVLVVERCDARLEAGDIELGPGCAPGFALRDTGKPSPGTVRRSTSSTAGMPMIGREQAEPEAGIRYVTVIY